MENPDTARAVAWLSRDPLLYMDMLEQLRMGEKLLYAGEDGVLLYCAPCGAYMLAGRDADAALRITRGLPRAPLFVAHRMDCVPALMEHFSYKRKMACYQSVYLAQEPPAVPDVCEIRPLSREHLGFVRAHYSNPGDWGEYLGARLDAGVLFGAWADGALAGFVGLHDEGSIGMLEVLPEFRRRGIAHALQAFMAGRLMEAGRVPFAQVEVDNAASLALQKKLGFSLCETPLCWLMDRTASSEQ